VLVLVSAATVAAQRPVSYATLSEGQLISGFRTTAVYLDATDRPMGGRFVHERSGFTLDLVQIESVPQAFVWVTTYPTSDMGEPHTQEHLLLGKGTKGLAVATHEPMSLASSTAFTTQWRTCYSFYTSAGVPVFYDEFERRMDALLHPDYSDEEIRREVRNFGVTENPADRSLGLEEKGSVYNEMVSSTDQPARRLRSAAITDVYGAGHPLQFNSGGSPEALRRLTPADIRSFHDAHYFLANMGAIVSLPASVPVASALQQMNALLTRVEPQRPSRPIVTEQSLAAPRPAPAGEIALVEYPNRNEQQPGGVYLVWPAGRSLDLTERTLLELFIDAFAGDPTTNLYKRFIDSRTREIPFGAQNVGGFVNPEQGQPVFIAFRGVPVAKMNQADLADLRTRVVDEFSRVAGWAPGSAELSAFNSRVHSRVVSLRRDLAKFVNSPPNFGFRSVGDDWLRQLDSLDKQGGFRRSLTMKGVLDAIDAIVARPDNVWTDRIAAWKLLNDEPWVLAAKPNPELAARQLQERADRAAAEVARLKAAYGVATGQEAIARYRDEYDKATVAIDAAAARATAPRFVDNPPLTLDDELQFKTTPLAGGIPMVASTFSSMTSATAGLALRLDGVPRDRLLWLAVLPKLLTGVGVIENGQPVSFERMSERLRQEILELNASFSTNPATDRVELTVRGAGNDAAEAQRAIAWMGLVLYHPDWRPENLPRIRDLLDQAFTGLRRTPQAPEENWVTPVATAYWKQQNPLLLTTTSFMTRAHQVMRLKWMLKDGTDADRTGAIAALRALASAPASRAAVKARLTELAGGTNPVLADAAKDLDVTLADVPDSSLALDWPRLCQDMAADLGVGPANALAALDGVRKEILRSANARLFVVGSAATQQALAASISTLVSGLDRAPVTRAPAASVKVVDARLRERDATAINPRYVGLLNPNSQSGVFLNSAPAAAFEATDRETVLDFLAGIVYAGGGSHSLFTKTIGAGLAYSNGINANPALGRVTYYAERVPNLSQTMQFVVNQIRAAKPDPALVEYAIAQSFARTRSANSYESRAEAMAENLADGLTPDIVSRFHARILELRGLGPNLLDELSKRKDTLPARVLPGLAPGVPRAGDAVTFVIGPEKQFASWETYVRSIDGPGATVYRLYPRDFWLTDDVASQP
jgi:Zn-dependent M16 (insulinase) family peptidase